MSETTNRETEKVRPRPYRFTVRLSPEEYAHIVEQARIVSRTPADLLRALGLGQRLKAIPKWPEDVFRAIKSFGNNLNQLARQANMGHVDAKAVEALTDEVHNILNFLRSRDKPVSQVATQSEEAGGVRIPKTATGVTEDPDKAGNLRSEAPY
jgi:Bacterial mobilisation protein (MobC)